MKRAIFFVLLITNDFYIQNNAVADTAGHTISSE